MEYNIIENDFHYMFGGGFQMVYVVIAGTIGLYIGLGKYVLNNVTK